MCRSGKRTVRISTAVILTVAILLVACAVPAGCGDEDKFHPPVFSITTPSLIVVPVGAPHEVQLAADYGTAPYHDWAIISGSLPTGYAFTTSTGLISGCAYTEGTYGFTVEVMDSSEPPRKVSKDFTLEVREAEWTLLVYLTGDNDIETSLLQDLEEMELAGGSSSQVNVVVQFDRIPGYDSSYGDWDTCKRFYVTEDALPSEIDSVELEDLGEVNMCSEATLRDFLTWGLDRFKAKKYALVIVDHGMTWKCLSSDHTDGHDPLRLTELRSALQLSLGICGLESIDFIGLDMCLAATFEAVAELRDLCCVLAASAELSPCFGWDFENHVGFLRDNPAATARQLGARIAESFEAVCEEADWESGAFIAIDLTNAQQALTSFEDSIAQLRTVIASHGLRLSFARDCVDEYDDSPAGLDTAVDLADLLYLLRHVSNDALIQSDLDAFLSTLNSMVIRKYCPFPHEYSTGISVFFPRDYETFQSDTYLYGGLRLTADSSWDELLPDYYAFRDTHVCDIVCTDSSVTDSVVTTANPVTLHADFTGNFIATVDFQVSEVIGDRLLVYEDVPVHNWRILPNGRKIENWCSRTEWSLSHGWSAECLMLTDGSVKSPVYHAFLEGEYWLRGEYSTDSGATWFECRAVYSPELEFADFFDASLFIPCRITAAPGDLFRPEQIYLSLGTGEETTEFGPAMDATCLDFVRLPVEPGEYALLFGVSDSIIRNLTGHIVTVPQDERP